MAEPSFTTHVGNLAVIQSSSQPPKNGPWQVLPKYPFSGPLFDRFCYSKFGRLLVAQQIIVLLYNINRVLALIYLV